ncbi:hypothetical protein [Nocardiopsis dassonvillei]|uniref:hypothetical protein n=1 Tax=Nocardiopsis dassonvillei TaxID=2014 RepID=UPI001E40384D|nr:hypothetical protein [Nocardiopsis dassonvillei]
MWAWDEDNGWCLGGERWCSAKAGHGQGRCRRVKEPVVPVAGQRERQMLLTDLRALVAYLEAHPQLPVGEMTRVEITYFPEGCDGHQQDQVVRLAEALGTRSRWEGEHFSCGKWFGQAGYRVVSIPERARKGELAAVVPLGGSGRGVSWLGLRSALARSGAVRRVRGIVHRVRETGDGVVRRGRAPVPHRTPADRHPALSGLRARGGEADRPGSRGTGHHAFDLGGWWFFRSA